MNVKRLSVVTGFLAMWAGACMASSQGVIQFHGSIVESSCTSVASSGSMMELKGCPLASRGSRINVHPVSSVKALGNATVNATANVKLVADSGSGRYYDQRYVLVDPLGKPIHSGAYVITLTSP
ncbi:type 1 fimbrial protein [Pseudomonas costantinii]|uniref:type 1 fimbrial protein n=1 Tax=Pseudomonas costantinii TaxID=168469 RepID=UPI0015A48F47|nr:type 1 fimbrial protein [Pseudomonas costantinii]NVZ69501.1 type 1 fimbrial protein [Pseudomonas costantinii]